MRTRDADILIIPGLGGSGPGHWQSRWESKLPTARRVMQDDWDRPVAAAWVAAIAETMRTSHKPIVLVAHSLGVVAAAAALTRMDAPAVMGAFLVAPPSQECVADIQEVAPDFRPYPSGPLPCPATLVASTDDPFASLEASEALALNWGATFLNAGAAGHINVASGHGPWPEGLMSFAGFMSKL